MAGVGRSPFLGARYHCDKVVSLELCPNKVVNVQTLQKLSPTFCSVVWHNLPDDVTLSGTPSISLAHELILRNNNVVVHLAGRYLTESRALRILELLKELNVHGILVLQGEVYTNKEEPFRFPYASDFITFIRQHYGSWFFIGVAAYVQAHPLSKNKRDDLKYLKLKVDAGADFIITQILFDPSEFFDFQKECRGIGISVPMLPGICVINSYRNVTSMMSYCKVEMPKSVMDILRDNRENPHAIRNYGLHYCSQLVKRLLSNDNVTGIHFFTFNDVKFVRKVCQLLRLDGGKIERPLCLCPYF